MHILFNAQIHTLNPQQPNASALALAHGRILALGSDDQIRREFADRATAEDMGGKTILPGLTDAHIHLRQFAFSLQKVDCATATRTECLHRVAQRAQTTPAGEWILGHGWDQNQWPQGFGDAAMLDAVAPENPVYLTAHSLHAGWANSAALRLAGITAQTPDPPDGQIQRNATGTPTGILFEGAMRLLSEAIPRPSLEQTMEALRQVQTELWKLGITGVHDFDRRDCFIALQTLHAQGQLKLRVIKSIPLEDLEHAIGVGLRSGFGDDFLRVGMVKAFADGALGPHTAAMFAPYEDDPDNRGMLLLDAEEIFEHGQKAVSNGLGMVIHAIGDRANHEVLEAYAQLRRYERQQGLPGPRHRIEHVQLLHPDDFPRLAQLDVIASMQPIHAISDMLSADRYWGERAANGYAWRRLLDLGTRLAFGSDAPVDSPNPFWGLHAAITRRRPDGTPGPQGWYPAQKITLLEALHAYTTGPAFAAGLENRLGCLAPGYSADLIVLARDPFTCTPQALRNTLPLRTMVAGEWVYTQ